MDSIKITPIGEIQLTNEGFAIKIKKEFSDGLLALNGYGQLNIIWWADQRDSPEYRKLTVIDKPYTKGPEKIGIFASRSPIRPNPIAITAVTVIRIDQKKGIVYTPYIDAEPGTPVLDIKPYLPSTDRFKNVKVPEWCRHWPSSIEESAEFNWNAEFNF